MVKGFDAKKAARQIIVDGALTEKASRADLETTLLVLSEWVRGGNIRAKVAEEKFHGQPIWKRKYQEEKRDVERLARERNAAEAKVEALRTQHREELLQQKEKFQADLDALEEKSARCTEMNDQMADALAKQETEFRERIAHLEQVAQAVGDHSNALTKLIVAERRVAEANLALAVLGLGFSEQDDED